MHSISSKGYQGRLTVRDTSQ